MVPEVVLEEGPLADGLVRNLREHGPAASPDGRNRDGVEILPVDSSSRGKEQTYENRRRAPNEAWRCPAPEVVVAGNRHGAGNPPRWPGGPPRGCGQRA